MKKKLPLNYHPHSFQRSMVSSMKHPTSGVAFLMWCRWGTDCHLYLVFCWVVADRRLTQSFWLHHRHGWAPWSSSEPHCTERHSLWWRSGEGDHTTVPPLHFLLGLPLLLLLALLLPLMPPPQSFLHHLLLLSKTIKKFSKCSNELLISRVKLISSILFHKQITTYHN